MLVTMNVIIRNIIATVFSHQRSNGLWHAFLGSLATLGAKSATLAVTNVLSLRGPLSPPQATPSGSDAIVELRLQKVRRARAAKFFRLWPSFVHKIPLQRAVSLALSLGLGSLLAFYAQANF